MLPQLHCRGLLARFFASGYTEAEGPPCAPLQICTVAISRRPGSTDAEGFPVSTSSSSGPERTASLVLPDSPVREAATAGAVQPCPALPPRPPPCESASQIGPALG
jgi:hypothetical protein